jgi:phospholipase C
LQFLEKFLSHKLGKAVRETNISQWRRTVCGDLTSAFRPATELADDRLKTPPRDEFIAEIHKARHQPLPSGYRALTDEEVQQLRADLGKFRKFARQEPGTKPSCPLPYELAAEGSLAEDGQKFGIRLEARKDAFGERSVGAPFTAYARGVKGDLEVRNYAVVPGDQLEDSWSLADFQDGRYDIAIHGPNGFYRRFQGAASDPPLEVRMQPVVSAKNGDAQFEITNRDSRAHTVTLTDRAYGKEVQTIEAPPSETRIVTYPAHRTHGWYDLSIQVAGDNVFKKTYAGRIETGAPSITDPAMA